MTPSLDTLLGSRLGRHRGEEEDPTGSSKKRKRGRGGRLGRVMEVKSDDRG